MYMYMYSLYSTIGYTCIYLHVSISCIYMYMYNVCARLINLFKGMIASIQPRLMKHREMLRFWSISASRDAMSR